MKNINLSFILLFIYVILFGNGIISMAPNITETLFYLNENTHIVGRTVYCNHPEKALEVDVVGSFYEMNYETIIDLDPEIVLFSDNLTAESKAFLDENDYSYCNVPMDDYDAVFTGMRDIQELIGSHCNIDSIKHYADSLIDVYKCSQDEVDVYIEVGVNPIIAGGSSTYIGSIVERLGYNVIDFTNKRYTPVSQELVIESDPDLLVIMSGSSSIYKRSGWHNISGIKKEHVIEFSSEDIDIFSRPGPRVINAISILGEYLDEIFP